MHSVRQKALKTQDSLTKSPLIMIDYYGKKCVKTRLQTKKEKEEKQRL
jgi:hypothetical protein